MTRKHLPPVGFSIPHLLLLCGGMEVVAKELGLSRIQWKTIPSKYVLRMVELTRLPIETLRPDLAPETQAVKKAGKRGAVA